MRAIVAFIKDKLRQIDPLLFVCTSILSLLSITVLIGARDSDYGGARTILMQAAMTVTGIVIMIIFANLDFSSLPTLFYIIVFIGSVGLMALLWTPLGESAGENRNWIKIPGLTSIQPSEFVRFSFILTFSKHLSVVGDDINHPKQLIGLALHAGVIVGLMLLSGDLGMALVYMGIIAVMLYCAGLSLWYFLGGTVLLGAVFPFIWDHLAEYQKKRIIVGVNPDIDPLDKGLQQIQSRACIAGGGITGRGINGAGTYKEMYGCLTDFFFATYAEMFGLLGCIVFIGLLAFLIARLTVLAKRSRGLFGTFVCAGVIGMIVVQSIENIGMCLCLLPVVGITLPFMSAGGSSVLSIYLIFGLVQSTFEPKSGY